MTLVMRDSIDATLIPSDTPVVAGYGDGLFIWSPSWKAAGGLAQGANWWDLFPRAVHLVIVVRPADAGDIADVETGDLAPADTPGWCRRFNRPGRRAPTLYVSRGSWPAVVAALRAAAVAPESVDWWVATLDGTTDLWFGSPDVPVPAGLRVVAVQVLDTGTYDESVILDPSWVGLEDDMTAEEHQLLVDVHNGMGTLVSIVPGQPEPLVFAIRDAVGALKQELDQVAAVQASGAPPDLTALQGAVAAVDQHVGTLTQAAANLSRHLGIGTP